jgi:hypothetical protein
MMTLPPDASRGINSESCTIGGGGCCTIACWGGCCFCCGCRPRCQGGIDIHAPKTRIQFFHIRRTIRGITEGYSQTTSNIDDNIIILINKFIIVRGDDGSSEYNVAA